MKIWTGEEISKGVQMKDHALFVGKADEFILKKDILAKLDKLSKAFRDDLQHAEARNIENIMDELSSS